MRLAVFDDHRLGVVEGDEIRDITGLVPAAFDQWPQQRMNWLIRNWAEIGPRLGDVDGPRVPLASVTLRAANPAPPQLFAIPANYRAHIGEIGDRSVTTGGRTAREAGFFLKAAGSLSGAGEPITLPAGSTRRFDHECELGVVIGRGGRNIPRERAFEHVFGYACLIDMTMRIERGKFEEDRSLRKSFRTFTPFGPFVVTADEIPDLDTLASRLLVNGEKRQGASLKDMIVSVGEAIELISSVVDIQPGDVIASGTPKGVAPVVPGDEVTIEIDSIGEMTLLVAEADPAPRPF
ncbi:fumarylacetoacetate hydrolase family protein [Streptomyces sp. ITFR-16]|uniref:fumarylacetoacetate hydrolase family protein n=1 Tax=Streptomyces sp. ITFR-16 TaxID=3075198 RepID=UPI002889FCA4|nr:fumarylacetoacetate hydrolase family protein [Streptomyces sp. ITFR-16]WNI21436.1 fumarylacetoacetate hydrolase family protein [Streptomyces sp. ITFR-16]